MTAPIAKVWVDTVERGGPPKIYMQAPAQLKEHCKSIPGGRWIADKKAWEYFPTVASAGELMDTFKPYNILYSPEVLGLAGRWDALTRRTTPTDARWPSTMPIDPWKHQLDAFQFMQGALGKNDGSVGLFSGMGTGKTMVATAIIAARKWARVMILCPSNMVEKWADELNHYAPSENFLTIPLTGPVKTRAEILLDNTVRKSPKNRAVIFVTNYEAIWRPPLFRAVMESGRFNCLILDEAQAIKSPAAKTSKAIYEIAEKVPFRIALTGTPAHDKLIDIYGIYRFLDPGIFGTSFEKFKVRYTHRRNFGKFSVITGYKNTEELSEKMYRIAFRVPEEVLNLPEGFPPIVRSVYLTKAGRDAYDEFKRRLILKRDEGEMIASNALVKLLRLQQITSGYVPLLNSDDKQIDEVQIDDSKANELRMILQEISSDEPVVVFAKFTKDLQQIKEIAELCGRRYMEESGKTKQWREWQEECKSGEVLGCQIDSGSSGISLFRSAYAIYFSLGFSLGDHLQSKKRILRPGQTQRVRYIYIIAKNTVDVQIMAALNSKKAIVDYVVSELWEARQT